MTTKRHFSTNQAREIAEKIGIDWLEAEFHLDEFRAGMDVELEHGSRDPRTDVTNDDPILTGKIAWAHLLELPDYYTRLAIMEEEGESERDRATLD